MQNAGAPHREIEIKLNLDSFTNYLKLIGFLGRIEHEENHFNGFFDTEDRKLAKAGWALRVRAENKRGLITIKSIGSQPGVAVVREEVESEVPRGEAFDILELRRDVMEQAVIPVTYIKEKIGAVAVSRLVTFHNIRQKKLFKIGDHNYMLEIDKTEFNDGSVDYEMELELGDLTTLECIDDQLRKLFQSLDIPFERQTQSKLARALLKARIF
jgi:uncharacterized protein YjbK